LRYESGLAKVATLGIKETDQEMAPLANKGGSSKERGGMSKRQKPEYTAGSLHSGHPGLVTAKPIPPAPPKPSE